METPSPYHPPVKRSLSIAGHQTAVSLEPLFWDMLKSAAAREGLAVAALVARIDAERIKSPTPPGLASAIRVCLVQHQLGRNVSRETLIQAEASRDLTGV
jgi:predicted DNA-binding ribbon-helix-helix protein